METPENINNVYFPCNFLPFRLLVISFALAKAQKLKSEKAHKTCVQIEQKWLQIPAKMLKLKCEWELHCLKINCIFFCIN